MRQRCQPAAGEHQDDGQGEADDHDQYGVGVVPQVRPESSRVDRAVIAGWTVERVGALLVEVNGCGECATHHSEHKVESYRASLSNSEGCRNRREQAKERNRVAPGAIRPWYRIAACREIPDQVILQHKHRDKPGQEYNSRRH